VKTTVSKKDVLELKSVFSEFDKRGTGQVSAREMWRIAQEQSSSMPGLPELIAATCAFF
jgi:Ca2+-binding EF-hand superfamily protein